MISGKQHPHANLEAFHTTGIVESHWQQLYGTALRRRAQPLEQQLLSCSGCCTGVRLPFSRQRPYCCYCLHHILPAVSPVLQQQQQHTCTRHLQSCWADGRNCV
jgi:hypothetical protein